MFILAVVVDIITFHLLFVKFIVEMKDMTATLCPMIVVMMLDMKTTAKIIWFLDEAFLLTIGSFLLTVELFLFYLLLTILAF